MAAIFAWPPHHFLTAKNFIEVKDSIAKPITKHKCRTKKSRRQSLPTETLIEIVQYLPLESGSYVSRTCKILHRIARAVDVSHSRDYLGPFHEKQGVTPATTGNLNKQYANLFKRCCRSNDFSKLRWTRVLDFSCGLILDQSVIFPEVFDEGSAVRVLLDKFYGL